MKINWYAIKFLFDDGIIQQLTIDKENNEIEIEEIKKEITMYQEDLKNANKEINNLLEQIEILKELSGIEETLIDISFNRITPGRNTTDKPSAHSQLTRKECKNIAKNVVATKKELKVIELSGDTNSMEPNLDDNHIIILHSYNPKTYEIKKQDIVRYLHPKLYAYVLHRVIDIKTVNGIKKYLIRGDNNPNSDGWYTDEVITDIACGSVWGEEPDMESDD